MDNGFDFNSLLKDGDSIRDLLPIQRREIEEYITVCKSANYPVKVFWYDLRDNWVTNQMDTIWHLTDRYFAIKYPGCIGNLCPPFALLEWILSYQIPIIPLTKTK